MIYVVIVLSILYAMGLNVGPALAASAFIEGVIIILTGYLKYWKAKLEDEREVDEDEN